MTSINEALLKLENLVEGGSPLTWTAAERHDDAMSQYGMGATSGRDYEPYEIAVYDDDDSSVLGHVCCLAESEKDAEQWFYAPKKWGGFGGIPNTVKCYPVPLADYFAFRQMGVGKEFEEFRNSRTQREQQEKGKTLKQLWKAYGGKYTPGFKPSGLGVTDTDFDGPVDPGTDGGMHFDPLGGRNDSKYY